mmetsp:Transcript_73943/g.239015  ORF Transcript_73943/g.239015 Transcript_73943/m.239015 type:complete len:862 (-) Transcript_73943:140-2725(-)
MAVPGEVHEVRSRPGKRQIPYVVFDQNGVLVVYKPPHWTMTTTMEMPRKTSIQAWLGDSLGHCYPYLQEDPLQAGLVQRLDVETSGPVVVATRSETFRRMWQLRAAGHFYREYVALLHGVLPVRHCCGTLEYSLNTRRRSSKVSERHGQPARTRYQAVAAFSRQPPGGGVAGTAAPRGYTLLRVRILTGRLHQIRVHLRELARRLGLPVCGVVGDYKYLPRSELAKDREFCPRVFLHARVLKFPLPGRQRGLCRVSCELPLDLTRVLHSLTPNDELTAEFTKLGDFLRYEQPEPLAPTVRTVHVKAHASRSRNRSRSPSHWRACCSPAREPSEETTREPSEGTWRGLSAPPLGAEYEPRPCWSPPLERERHRSPSPCHWCPPPSPSASPSPSPSPSSRGHCSTSQGGSTPIEPTRRRARSGSPDTRTETSQGRPAKKSKPRASQGNSRKRSRAAHCCLSILDKLMDQPMSPIRSPIAPLRPAPDEPASPMLLPQGADGSTTPTLPLSPAGPASASPLPEEAGADVSPTLHPQSPGEATSPALLHQSADATASPLLLPRSPSRVASPASVHGTADTAMSPLLLRPGSDGAASPPLLPQSPEALLPLHLAGTVHAPALLPPSLEGAVILPPTQSASRALSPVPPPERSVGGSASPAVPLSTYRDGATVPHQPSSDGVASPVALLEHDAGGATGCTAPLARSAGRAASCAGPLEHSAGTAMCHTVPTQVGTGGATDSTTPTEPTGVETWKATEAPLPLAGWSEGTVSPCESRPSGDAGATDMPLELKHQRGGPETEAPEPGPAAAVRPAALLEAATDAAANGGLVRCSASQPARCPRSRKRAALATLDALAKRLREDPFRLWDP